MKKNLLNKAAALEIAARAEKLEPTFKSLWGEMNVTEMLAHCNQANIQVLEKDMEYKAPTNEQKFFKILSLYVVPRFPKNIKSPLKNDTAGKIDESRFREEKAKFIEIIHRFPLHSKRITLVHPFFGPLTNIQWGIATWKHMDHHLRQFGV